MRPSESPLPEAHHGLASYWRLEVDGRVDENATWTNSAAPPTEGEQPAAYVALAWEAMYAWYEEEERILGYPRDPYHRIDTR